MSNGRVRYGSIFSGAILTLAGVLLLLHSYYPDFEIWRVFSHWWPLLLIFWGLVKLYEWKTARRAGVGPSGNLTGGEVLLVIALLLLAGAVGGVDWIRSHRDIVDLSDIGLLRGNPYLFTEEIPAKTVAAASHVSISLGRGDVTVVSGDAPEIRVVAKKTAYASNQQEGKSAADRVRVEVADKGNGDYEIRPGVSEVGGNRVEVGLEVHLPKQASVAVMTGRGDVRVSGVNGNVSAQVRNGDIDIRNSGGDVSLNTTHGDLHVIGAAGNVKIAGHGGDIEIADVKGQVAIEGEFFGPIRMARVDKGVRFLSRRTDLTVTKVNGHLEAGSGRVEISNTNGDVTLVTHKSDVKIENAGGRVQITDDGGDIELNFSQPPLADISLESRSGDLSLTLPPQSNFQLDAQTQNGSLDCDFPGLASPGGRNDDNRSLVGQAGSRGPTIHLRTQHGDIRISKKKS
jgi:DUF4097 and DUF4098 domain-containing protein YvlB